MYTAAYDYFGKHLDCSHHSTSIDNIFKNIIVALDSTIENEMGKLKDKLSNSEPGKKKDELPQDAVKETCFLKIKVFWYTTVKGEELEKHIGITKCIIENQNTIDD